MSEWLHEIRFRMKAVLRRRRLHREMAEELAFHQAMLRESWRVREQIRRSSILPCVGRLATRIGGRKGLRNYGSSAGWRICCAT